MSIFMNRCIIKTWTMLLMCLVHAGAAGANAVQEKERPAINGTFIQDYLVKDWNDEQWMQEIHALKEAGMQYIVFCTAAFSKGEAPYKTLYPTSIPGLSPAYNRDLLDACLRNAEKTGMKVFIGINFNEQWWGRYPEEWLYRQMEAGNEVADEILQRYKKKYRHAFYGWYWIWEVDNLNYVTPGKQEMLAKALDINVRHLHKISPRMPVMLCPFMNYRVGAANEYVKMWEYVFKHVSFKPGDIFAPQDGIGAGGLTLEVLGNWYKQLAAAVKTKPGLLFWSDAETFDYVGWTAAPIDRFVTQMKIVQPYVSGIISFAYSHYYSPVSADSGYHEAYLHYLKTGAVLKQTVPPVSGLEVKWIDSTKASISWNAPDSLRQVCGYYIYRDGKLLRNLQGKKNIPPSTIFTDEGITKHKIYTYEVASYDYYGNIAIKASRVLVDETIGKVPLQQYRQAEIIK